MVFLQVENIFFKDMSNCFKFFSLSLLLLSLVAVPGAEAQTFVEASDLTLVGNLFPDTPHPYHRLDTAKYKGFDKKDITVIVQSSGLAVAFKTNSKNIRVQTEYGYRRFGNFSSGIALRGYDLYIKKDGKWLFATAGVVPEEQVDQPFVLMPNLDGSVHECLLYLPLYSEELSVKIGVDEGSFIEPLENPFRHRVGIFGSSFTHGGGATRSGMTYPAIFTRDTGIQLLSLGVSGRSKLQPAFARALADADVEAFIFDSFSNPSLEQIKKNLFPFIETIQAKKPGIPLIFQRTIYRESRNFNTVKRKFEEDRQALADSLMDIACKKYKDVYYIKCTDAASPEHDTSVEGTHPSDYGYFIWARSIEKPILKILRKYGIK